MRVSRCFNRPDVNNVAREAEEKLRILRLRRFLGAACLDDNAAFPVLFAQGRVRDESRGEAEEKLLMTVQAPRRLPVLVSTHTRPRPPSTVDGCIGTYMSTPFTSMSFAASILSRTGLVFEAPKTLSSPFEFRALFTSFAFASEWRKAGLSVARISRWFALASSLPLAYSIVPVMHGLSVTRLPRRTAHPFVLAMNFGTTSRSVANTVSTTLTERPNDCRISSARSLILQMLSEEFSGSSRYLFL